MKSTQNTQSIHTSMHQIINENNKKLRKNQINHLFVAPELNQIDTAEFNRHSFMYTNDLFTFFVHQLEKWNKKIRNKEVSPFYHAEQKKYHFIQSSLKIISKKNPNQIDRYLNQLYLWYTKNSYNIPQPSVLMKKYDLSQQWEVRKTFKSNTTSEINNYRRRFFCSPQDKSECFKMLGISIKKDNYLFNSQSNPSLKKNSSKDYDSNITDVNVRNSQNQELFKQINQNNELRMLKKINSQIRLKRDQQQIRKSQDKLKATQSRFSQKSCQNFYKATFKTNKQFSQSTSRIQPRKTFTAFYNIRHSQQEDLKNNIKKRRLQTSLGIRKNFNNQRKNSSTKIDQIIQNSKTESNEKSKQFTSNWIDNFIVDEQKISITNTFDSTGTAMKLMSNPFETGKGKIKRKKK